MKNPIVVTKHKDLIEASYKLNLEEQRLLLLCISKIDPRKDIPDKIAVTALEYGNVYSIQSKHAYDKLKLATDKIYERDIKIKNAETDERVRWVYQVNYHKGAGEVTLRFSPTVKPYLCQLTSLFKSYQLKNISGMKSVHSIRLYELLNEWRESGKRFINLCDFKNMLQLEEKYDRYTDLRKWVIEPSVREVNSKTDFNVSFMPKKKGRKITSLTFIFSEKNKGSD